MTFTPAKTIDSPQLGIHKNLEKTLRRYTKSTYQKPIAEHTQEAFEQAFAYWRQHSFDAVFLDSACGTAESTRFLAAQNPKALVIGLDQSLKRLSHSDNQQLPKNSLVLRCDCTDFWRLAQAAKWYFDYHSLYYPNPYPKPDDLQKRWHGHPTFTALLEISQQIELRTNWKTYAEEFEFALKALGKGSKGVEQYTTDKPITAFERKYLKSGHALWRVFSQ